MLIFMYYSLRTTEHCRLKFNASKRSLQTIFLPSSLALKLEHPHTLHQSIHISHENYDRTLNTCIFTKASDTPTRPAICIFAS